MAGAFSLWPAYRTSRWQLAAVFGDDKSGGVLHRFDSADGVNLFDFIWWFFSAAMTASNAATRAAYGRDPAGPTLVEDTAAGALSV